MSTDTRTGGPRLPLETIAATLAPFRTGLSEAQLQAVRDHLFLLLEWNRAINLTAIEDPAEILSRHFGESMFAASLLRMDESRLADVGTGAGFPGIPLKIACPDLKLTLFEPNYKKCAFLKEVSRKLQLSDVTIYRQRYEEFRSEQGGFDFICARALGNYQDFLIWSRNALMPAGRVILWLGTDESIRLGRRREFFWDTPVPIPGSKRRVILIGRKENTH